MDRNQQIEMFFNNSRALQHMWKDYYNMHAQTADFSPAQMGLLHMITHHQPISSKQIAERMRVSPSAVAQLLDPLFSSNVIEKKPDAKDRRVSYISLSKKGSRHLKAFSKRRREIMTGLASELTTEELSLMIKIQSKMLMHLQNNINK